jgi:hypothetical protein
VQRLRALRAAESAVSADTSPPRVLGAELQRAQEDFLAIDGYSYDTR